MIRKSTWELYKMKFETQGINEKASKNALTAISNGETSVATVALTDQYLSEDAALWHRYGIKFFIFPEETF